jgi:hypothetical protein
VLSFVNRVLLAVLVFFFVDRNPFCFSIFLLAGVFVIGCILWWPLFRQGVYVLAYGKLNKTIWEGAYILLHVHSVNFNGHVTSVHVYCCLLTVYVLQLFSLLIGHLEPSTH